jgi:CheY-like chemotaxis protein/anti-anti-sigma regulatory factor
MQGFDTARKPTILVVDDMPDNIDVLRAILGETYRVKAATSGESALSVAAAEPRPDLVLLDLVMPGMGGFAVCRALKADPATRAIPVIFVTSRDDPADESEGFAAGAVDYIHKPVNPYVVSARVKTHLELHTARHHLEKQNEVLRENARLREDVEAVSRHDLKNPLTAILWASSMLLEGNELAERDRQLIRIVADSGRKILDMINRSVDLVKMERGAYVLRAETVDALRLVRQVADSQSKNAAYRKGGIDIVVDGVPPAGDATFAVMGEELLIYSMLGNLVANAVEASPPRRARHDLSGARAAMRHLHPQPRLYSRGHQAAIHGEVRDVGQGERDGPWCLFSPAHCHDTRRWDRLCQCGGDRNDHHRPPAGVRPRGRMQEASPAASAWPVFEGRTHMFRQETISRDEAVLVVSGPLTGDAVSEFQTQMEKLSAGSFRTISLDLSEATSISSAALGKVILFRKMLREQGKTLRIERCSNELYAMFKQLQLGKLIDIKQ